MPLEFWEQLGLGEPVARVALIVASVVSVAIVAFAVIAERRVRRRRRRVRHMASHPAPDIAYRAVVNARSAFTRSVEAYETALASSGALSQPTAPGGPDGQTPEGDLETIERQKDDRRTRLMEAQRMWEQVKPSLAPNSPVPVWLGAGTMSGWSLGVVGFETAILRIQHALDPECWVVVETRRFRFGPALGAERLHLGMILEGAAIHQVTGLIQQVMGSPEVALRPGTSLVRWAGRTRVSGRELLDALRAAAGTGDSVYADGLGREVRNESLTYLGGVRGLNLDENSAGLAGAFGSINLRITSSGPAVLAGAWWGRRPAVRILAGSNHQTWIRRSSPDGY